MKKHRQGTRPKEVPFLVNTLIVYQPASIGQEESKWITKKWL